MEKVRHNSSQDAAFVTKAARGKPPVDVPGNDGQEINSCLPYLRQRTTVPENAALFSVSVSYRYLQVDNLGVRWWTRSSKDSGRVTTLKSLFDRWSVRAEVAERICSEPAASNLAYVRHT
ncbi:Gas vesicle synthesis GvpLGvpF [Anopheles sinensis]|uniref:Gas vesicle synthesis GvpLGvpF n=1 Tax=Anopheles sinensis TaxID=74873 RepID=A0A084WRI1_ANOSI|nr:Gas vesicle synthesis GvpLGvpF [Anopheles sinensis]